MSRTVEGCYFAGQRLPDAEVFTTPGHLIAKPEQTRQGAGDRRLATGRRRPDVQVNASREVETATRRSVHHGLNAKGSHLNLRFGGDAPAASAAGLPTNPL